MFRIALGPRLTELDWIAHLHGAEGGNGARCALELQARRLPFQPARFHQRTRGTFEVLDEVFVLDRDQATTERLLPVRGELQVVAVVVTDVFEPMREGPVLVELLAVDRETG